MTVVYCGMTAEEIGGTPYTGAARARDDSYAAEEAQFAASSGQGLTASYPTDGATDLWAHVRVWIESQQTIDNANSVFVVGAEDGTELFYVWINNSNWVVQTSPGRAEANQTTTGSGPMVLSTATTLDVHCYHDAVNDRMKADLYVNGVLASEAGFDAAAAIATRIFRWDNKNIVNRFSFWSGSHYLSELLITSGGVSTLGKRLVQMDPAAMGANTDLTGDIDGIQATGDGLVLAGDTAGLKGSWTLTTYPGPASPANLEVVTVTRSLKGLTGPQNLRHLLRVGGTDYAGADLSPEYKGSEVTVWGTNPATGLPWATSDLTGIEQGVEIRP